MRKHQAWLEKPGGRGGGDLAAAGGTGAGHQQRGARGAGQAGARGPGGARAAAEVGRGGLRRRRTIEDRGITVSMVPSSRVQSSPIRLVYAILYDTNIGIKHLIKIGPAPRE